MNRMREVAAAVLAAWAVSGAGADAQSLDVVGARAAGMSGAFVGVADDASAAYWNPGGLASGAYFSLLIDGGTEREAADFALRGRKQSSFLIALVMPALGLTYYRLEHRIAAPFELLVPLAPAPNPLLSESAPIRVDALVTHHAGVTFVQSLLENVAVGTTVKLVRGVASSASAGFLSAGSALDVDDLPGLAANRFDLDVGVMASLGSLKAGVTLRNVREPEFDVPDGSRTLRLERQARAGASYLVLPAWLVAADIDLLETTDAVGPRRDLAFGVEGRLTRRLTARGGARFNTVTTEDFGIGTGRSASVGASFAVRGSVLVDGAAILGDERMGRGWRIGARFVY